VFPAKSLITLEYRHTKVRSPRREGKRDQPAGKAAAEYREVTERRIGRFLLHRGVV
jgi:hypothetical protein